MNELLERRGHRLARRREELTKGAEVGGFVTVSKGTGRTNARGQSKGVGSYGRLLSWRGGKIRVLFRSDVPGASTRSPAGGKGHEVKGSDRQRRAGP